jgi:hypothetical protein
MNDDRCCGSGTCIINADDECWCGQKWDGEKMSFVKLKEIGNDESFDRTASHMAGEYISHKEQQ